MMNCDFFSFDAGEKIVLTFLLKRRTKGKPDLKKIIKCSEQHNRLYTRRVVHSRKSDPSDLSVVLQSFGL